MKQGQHRYWGYCKMERRHKCWGQRRLDGEQVGTVGRLEEIQLEQESRDCSKLQAGKRMVLQKMGMGEGQVLLHELVLAIPNRDGEVVL